MVATAVAEPLAAHFFQRYVADEPPWFIGFQRVPALSLLVLPEGLPAVEGIGSLSGGE
jgi:hypothetical protein